MKKDNVLQDKSFSFAVRIVNLCKQLVEGKEYILSKQLLRSGTGIGAIVEEAIGAQSDKDFFAKITIAYKETRETKYWIRLLKETGYISIGEADDLLNETEQLLRIHRQNSNHDAQETLASKHSQKFVSAIVTRSSAHFIFKPGYDIVIRTPPVIRN